ncbi:MAG: restriction endonuclease subunit S [Phycisphaerales bacterium]|nr:restriction endonuclease subunit S [Phycisphaerales bacterium]
MNRNNKFKKTPIGLIPEDWDVKKLGEMCLINGDYGINAAAVDYSEDLPTYIRITDIDDDGLFSFIKKVSVDDIKSANFYLDKNDIVFVRTGATTGKAYLYKEKDGKLVFAGFLIRFRVDINKVDDYFLWSYTKSKPYLDWVKTTCTRSGQPGINSTEYSSLLIPLPPLVEQQKIAVILSTWDSAIDKCKAIIEKLKVRNKGLARVLLSESRITQIKGLHGKNTKNNQSVSSVHSDKSVIQTNEKWKRVKLGELCKIKKGEQLNRIGLNSTGQYPVINGGVTPSGYTEKWNTLENTITISEGGNSCGFINLIASKFWSGGHCYTLLQLKECVENKYLFFYLKNNEEKIMKLRVGSGLPNIQLPAIFNLLIILPPLYEQQKIVAILDTAVLELNNYEQKLLILQEQKKGLMQRLLTGKVRVRIN